MSLIQLDQNHLDRHSTKPLYRQVAKMIRKAILTGQLKTGDKLPSRLVLIKQLKVNLATIRSAFALLEKQGLIFSKTGSGTFVCEPARSDEVANIGRDLGQIVLVLGKSHFSQFRRDQLDIITTLMAGLEDVLGRGACQFVCVESLDEASLAHINRPGIVLLYKPTTVDPAMLERFRMQGVPVVSAMNFEFAQIVPCVGRQPHQCIALACQHLFDCGYRKLGYIGDLGSNTPLSAKFFGFTSTHFQAGLDYQLRYVRDVSIHPGEAYHAAMQLINDGLPDAIVVDTDWKALEVLAALKHAGVRVPEDIGVVGNDGIVEAAHSQLKLTTVSSPRFESGQVIARQWLDWLDHKTPFHSVTLDATLVQGGTTADRHVSNLEESYVWQGK